MFLMHCSHCGAMGGQRDEDFNVRIAAVWSTVAARPLSAAEKISAVTKLAQNEQIEAVLDNVKDALSVMDEVSEH